MIKFQPGWTTIEACHNRAYGAWNHFCFCTLNICNLCTFLGIKLRVMRCATFVLMSSTATFTIFNPLRFWKYWHALTLSWRSFGDLRMLLRFFYIYSSQQPSATRSSLFLSPGRLARTRGCAVRKISMTWNLTLMWFMVVGLVSSEHCNQIMAEGSLMCTVQM